jgi:molybdopterin converting factor subunit 1
MMAAMRLQVLYFAGLRDQVGRDEETVSLVEGNSVAALCAQLTRSVAGFSLEAVRVAVNEEFVGQEHALREGDVVAFIPPVSGG